MEPDAATTGLISVRQTSDGGAAVRRAAERGELRRVHRGWYVATAAWDAAYSEQRHRWQVLAVASSMGDTARPIFVRSSAAVCWGLPLFRQPPKRVHVAATTADGRASSPGLVARHRIDVPAADRVEIGGLACTSLERTVIDMARTSPVETGVACADAAMRLRTLDPVGGGYDLDRAEAFREKLIANLGRHGGARGVRRARFVVSFADGRAELPGESLSRLMLHTLGYASPRLQVAVRGPGGRDYRVDFGLDDVNAWGEFDGRGKYGFGDAADAAAAAEVVEAEKRREDWIRGVTGRRMIRWGMSDLRSLDVFAQRLAAFGAYPRGLHRRILP
ncbi:MAG: hypothetical protein PGN24_01830 [Microbacterium arborescens]